MCQTCPHAERSASGSAVACTLNGTPIVALVHRLAACPVGRHPDEAGLVRWAGARWLGVPEPLRWVLLAQLGRDARGLVGCGCLARLKASRAGPWLEPALEAVQTLRGRVAALWADWRACRSGGV